MRIKTGNLRNNLSRYLKRVRQTGETIVVLDREEPIAELRPFSGAAEETAPDVWGQRAKFIKQAGTWDEDFELPARHTDQRKERNVLD